MSKENEQNDEVKTNVPIKVKLLFTKKDYQTCHYDSWRVL
jgi:hypothetical protein